MENRKHKVWIVVDKEGQVFSGFWFTKKEATRGHCFHFGFMQWKDAYINGHRCIQAELKYSL